MAKIIVTAKDTAYRLSPVSANLLVPQGKPVLKLVLNPKATFQKILGFGGAFTESACYNLYRVGKETREKALRLYFDPEEGIGYSIGRVSIHGCDFSLSSYTYIQEGDAELKTFDIARDRTYVIPIIRRAEEIAGKKISLLASPWTPPAFMKDNNSPLRGGHLLEKFADAWARYFLRFIQEYRKEKLTIWGVSVQNEPAAVQRWDSCIYSPEQERDFVKNHLGPILKNSDAKDVNILVWDHNRDIIVERVTPIYQDKEASQYIWGTAFHWYVSEAFENVGKVHNLFPDKGLLFTEGCVEGGVKIDAWHTGERYAFNMIGDLNNFCEGYIDWNLWLDTYGGPNHVNNLCDAPILIDIFPEKLVLESSYYYIGQISKYVKPGALRIASLGNHANLQTVAFQNPSGEIVVILLNKSAEAVAVEVAGAKEKVQVTSLARSITTVLI